jgi:hypothetical protein
VQRGRLQDPEAVAVDTSRLGGLLDVLLKLDGTLIAGPLRRRKLGLERRLLDIEPRGAPPYRPLSSGVVKAGVKP